MLLMRTGQLKPQPRVIRRDDELSRNVFHHIMVSTMRTSLRRAGAEDSKNDGDE